jgi:predicted GH43/DUF377 family glycosyl hydrolase
MTRPDVSQGAVFRERSRWYSLYSYRTAKKVLPGLRLAISTDGTHWRKESGPDLLIAAPESQYIEWHQVYKIGKRYVMLYEGYNGGKRWGADIAFSDRLTSGWKKAPLGMIDQTRWENYSDQTLFHVATPALYQIRGHWYLYFQAARAGYYIRQNWALWEYQLMSCSKRSWPCVEDGAARTERLYWFTKKMGLRTFVWVS